MKKILLIFSLALLIPEFLHSQGCVAIRSMSTCGGLNSGIIMNPGESVVSTNFRYFESFRHFRGPHEEAYRVAEGTQVINDSYFLDINFAYSLSSRLFLNAAVPIVFHERSSMYEHGGNPPNGLGERHLTRAKGLSDVRIGAGFWLLNPSNHHKGNLSLGLGAKLPTGNYKATDVFYNQGTERNENIEMNVDQSIQPGDGGFGITLDIQAFYLLNSRFALNGNFYYLSNPRETNGALTRNGTTEFSVPDQVASRLGISYAGPMHGLSLYLGGRYECVPSEDLIGGSDGFRRPGYVWSIEPGLNYSRNQFSAFIGVPVALERNRTQSYLDKLATIETGEYRHGDAAFADYAINASISWRFNKKERLVEK